MNKYRIKMNDKVYEMEIELISGTAPTIVKHAAAGPTPVKAAPVIAAPAVSKATSTTEGSMRSPMPGTILKVKAAVGDTVQKGQTILVLEAMKMENEIAAPLSGTVTEMKVLEGQTVANGELLFTIK